MEPFRMDAEIIDRMRREEAELTRKLEAVRGLLRAYGATPFVSQTEQQSGSKTREATSGGNANRGREKMPLERFSEYGQSVVKAAIKECARQLGKPISSRNMVDLVEKQGIEVSGQDKINALSALLARSIDLETNGRKGWTLSEEYRERQDREIREMFEDEPRKENAPQNGLPDILGADAEEESAATPPSSLRNPFAVRHG